MSGFQHCQGNENKCTCLIQRKEFKELFGERVFVCQSPGCQHPIGDHVSSSTPTTGLVANLEASGVDIAKALVLGSYSLWRHIVEKFAEDFKAKHALSDYQKLCKDNISSWSTSATLRHFETCKAVWRSKCNLFDDCMCEKLELRKIRPPSHGSFKSLFDVLSTNVHETSLMVTEKGKVIIPAALPSVDKRLLVRFLKAEGNDVLVMTSKGLRDPDKDEVHAPEKNEQAVANTSKRSSSSPLMDAKDSKSHRVK